MASSPANISDEDEWEVDDSLLDPTVRDHLQPASLTGFLPAKVLQERAAYCSESDCNGYTKVALDDIRQNPTFSLSLPYTKTSIR